MMKRALDIVGAGLCLLLAMPLLLALVLAVRASSPGPALFRQRRVGRDGREFMILKLRTMVEGAERLRPQLIAFSSGPDWLDVAQDPRVTALGRFLRRTSLDELPQLLNVLRGHMSLVGPRPLPIDEDARVPEWARLRAAVRPGLTGLWQVSGRTRLGFADMLRLDCQYARRMSLRLDLWILLRTLPAVLTGSGAK
jgi:lipopolysaccharide/colanic/teichoic acid biosynthesis glycosyltransferase